MRQGVRYCVDVGKVRIGVAKSDPEGMLAIPVATLQRSDENWIQQFQNLLAEQPVIECVVGLPLSLDGSHTNSTQDAIDVCREIASICLVDCRLVDERFSTTSALGAMRSAGISQKESRSFIDQVAAVNILQYALDTEKKTGKPAGISLTEFSG